MSGNPKLTILLISLFGSLLWIDLRVNSNRASFLVIEIKVNCIVFHWEGRLSQINS